MLGLFKTRTGDGGRLVPMKGKEDNYVEIPLENWIHLLLLEGTNKFFSPDRIKKKIQHTLPLGVRNLHYKNNGEFLILHKGIRSIIKSLLDDMNQTKFAKTIITGDITRKKKWIIFDGGWNDPTNIKLFRYQIRDNKLIRVQV